MATISDVAKRAKVSVTTVSRILNGERNVASTTAEAVHEAIQALEYTPRAVRPGPRPKNRVGVNKGTVAFLSVSDFEPEEMYRMPAFPRLLAGIKRALDRSGMDLLLSHSPEGKAVPQTLSRRLVDGVVLFGDQSLSPALKSALNAIPSVWCFREQDGDDVQSDQVMYNNSRIGTMAGDYLIQLGHRRLAYISNSPNHTAFSSRRDQFKAAAASTGASCSILEEPGGKRGDQRAKAAREMTDQLLSLQERPSGIFCASDEIMLTVFNRCLQRGVVPGRDLDLIGCNNDTTYMDQMYPRPATIDLKLDLVGERAVEQLLRRLANPADRDRSDTLIKPALVTAEQVSRSALSNSPEN
ncbi:MAG: LacI family DNA-binding transcriptional regulator [Opitutaceae bacterium]